MNIRTQSSGSGSSSHVSSRMACEDPESENCKHAGWAISFSISRHGMMPISVAAKRTAFGGIPVRFTKEKAALNCLEFSWPLVVNWSNHGSVPSPGGYFNIPRSCNKVPCSGMRWLHALYLNIEHWWHNYSTKLKTTVRQTALQPSCPTFCQKPQALLSERRTLALHPLSIASAQVMAVESSTKGIQSKQGQAKPSTIFRSSEWSALPASWVDERGRHRRKKSRKCRDLSCGLASPNMAHGARKVDVTNRAAWSVE